MALELTCLLWDKACHPHTYWVLEQEGRPPALLF